MQTTLCWMRRICRSRGRSSPSENFLLEMLEGNDAVLMSVWTERDEDVAVTLSGQEAGKRIDGAEIQYGAKGNVWVAVTTAPQIWHVRDIGKEDAEKVIPLEWKQPFSAVWRVDWHRTDRLADSWEMIMELPDGTFSKRGWGGMDTVPADRKRWATAMGDFLYPCWIDKNGQGNLQPLWLLRRKLLRRRLTWTPLPIS